VSKTNEIIKGITKIKLGEVIRNSFHSLFVEPSLFVPPLVGMALSTLTFWISLFLFSGIAGTLMISLAFFEMGMLSTSIIMTIVLVVVSFVLGIGIQVFVSAWTESMLLDVEKTGKTSIEGSFLRVRSKFWKEFFACIFTGFVSALLSIFIFLFVLTIAVAFGMGIFQEISTGRPGIYGFHAPALIGLGLLIIFILIIPFTILSISFWFSGTAIMKHDVGLFSALRLSWRFTMRNFWRIVFLFLLIIGVSLVPYVGELLGLFLTPLWMPYAYMRHG